MANNWAFIIWIGITGLLCNAFGGKRQELVNGKSEVRTTWFWAIAIFIPIALGAALRTTAEGDSPLSSSVVGSNVEASIFVHTILLIKLDSECGPSTLTRYPQSTRR